MPGQDGTGPRGGGPRTGGGRGRCGGGGTASAGGAGAGGGRGGGRRRLRARGAPVEPGPPVADPEPAAVAGAEGPSLVKMITALAEQVARLEARLETDRKPAEPR